MISSADISKKILFSDHKIQENVRSCVVIPVKNEETHLHKTLNAFCTQTDSKGNKIDLNTFEILILANNCSDSSVEIVKTFQKNNPFLNIYLEEILLSAKQANIGFVRKLLMETAFRRLEENGGGIMMTTDGDTTVSPNWISQTTIEIEKGADAVCGRIFLCPVELRSMDSFTHSLHLKDEKYRLLVAELETKIMRISHNPAPSHHQHFNGSFAVTTDCYKKSGGIPDVAYLEDCAFFERLKMIDAKVRHSNEVFVHTSARIVGRTEIGLSYQLNLWKNSDKESGEILVESGDFHLDQFLVKRKLLDLWESRDCSFYKFCTEIKKISSTINADDKLYSDFINHHYFGEWYHNFIQSERKNLFKEHSLVSIDDAIMELQSNIANYSRPVFSHTSIL